jgi:predicted O-linked N-acetylglucosamine transferase (SPINDLY family)
MGFELDFHADGIHSERVNGPITEASGRHMTLPIHKIYNQQLADQERQIQEFWTQSLVTAQKAVLGGAQSADAHLEVASCLTKLRRHKEALAVLEQALARVPRENSYDIYRWQINLLEKCNCTRAAIALAHRAGEVFPADLSFKISAALALPVVYDSTQEIEEYRAQFARGLQKLTQEVLLETPMGKKNALETVANYSNSFLGYQARNDRELQMEYGQFLHRIMAANYPEWAKPISIPEILPREKLRVGYVSARFRNLSAAKYFSGWIREHKKDDFSVFAYHVGAKTDSITEEIRKSSDIFQHIPESLEEICRTILKDKLHILVFLDVCLEPITTQLAALRLASIQCAAWDQPITTGLPTIDYFISSAVAEPENAKEHYSEKLLLLPGIGVNYPKPVIPSALLTKTRRDFQLRDDAVVYLCIQYAYKYLPDQDHLLAQIAKEVPKAQFVFLTENNFIAADLQRRLDRAFSAANLAAKDYCVLLPAVERFTYWNISLLGDVFLDSIGWSGGVSTLEAIACRLPIVTIPGEFMRGRQTYAILTELGVTDTIAKNAAEYVQIAVRLGTDRTWRDDIVHRMAANYSSVYSDTRCVRALEDFYTRTVDARLRARENTAVIDGHK